MFNKLRNRFLILNLVIISFMMLLAFSSIYTITYQNVRNDISMELHRVSDFNRKNDNKFGQPKRDGNPPQQQNSDPALNPPQERSISFTLETDGQWNITQTDSRFEMGDDFYRQAIAKVKSRSSTEGRFTLDGDRWAYLVQNNGNGHSVVFLDVTARQNILTNLVYTFLAVGFAMLIIIYFTSRFFANRSIQPVREAFNKQKQFIADASHELKTPLAVINTNADVLLANDDDTIRNQSKWLHHIKSETERMKTLTNDLLYLTEMDDAKTGMIHANFNLSEAVEGVLLTMEAVVFEKELSLDYEIEPNLMVRGNMEQIKQVTMILLDNAIKYTSPKGSINLTLRKRHNDVQLMVANTGDGIPPEHLGKIFDRFYRADPSRSRKQGGYGLGLAIAKSIVEQHKGKIHAKSAVEQTTFYVQLP